MQQFIDVITDDGIVHVNVAHVRAIGVRDRKGLTATRGYGAVVFVDVGNVYEQAYANVNDAEAAAEEISEIVAESQPLITGTIK